MPCTIHEHETTYAAGDQDLDQEEEEDLPELIGHYVNKYGEAREGHIWEESGDEVEDGDEQQQYGVRHWTNDVSTELLEQLYNIDNNIFEAEFISPACQVHLDLLKQPPAVKRNTTPFIYIDQSLAAFDLTEDDIDACLGHEKQQKEHLCETLIIFAATLIGYILNLFGVTHSTAHALTSGVIFHDIITGNSDCHAPHLDSPVPLRGMGPCANPESAAELGIWRSLWLVLTRWLNFAISYGKNVVSWANLPICVIWMQRTLPYGIITSLNAKRLLAFMQIQGNKLRAYFNNLSFVKEIKEIGSIWKEAAHDLWREVWQWIFDNIDNFKRLSTFFGTIFGIPYCVWNYGIIAVVFGCATLYAVTTLPGLCYKHAKFSLIRAGALQNRKQQGKKKQNK